MSALFTFLFYLTAWLFTWAFIEISDRRKLNRPGLTYSERMTIEDERIPAWGWICAFVFFLILFGLVPFVGFAAGLT